MAEANAGQLYSTLSPALEQEATNPQGFAPTDLAAMNTAAQESAGGSEAAAVGQGGLKAARTRNAGGADAAIAQSARTSGENLSKAALGTQIKNAMLKEQQRQSGLSGLERLDLGELGAGTGDINAVSNAVNANTNAANASWDWAKDLLDPALAAAGQSKYT